MVSAETADGWVGIGKNVRMRIGIKKGNRKGKGGEEQELALDMSACSVVAYLWSSRSDDARRDSEAREKER